MRKLRYFLTLTFVFAALCSCEDVDESNLYESLGGDSITPEYNTTNYFIPDSPWPTIDLFDTPEYYLEDTSEEGVLAIVYKALPYRGNKNHVFCYYSSPSLLNYGDTSHDEDIPAVVCIHGGGGSASASWVRLLAEKGYAALAMDWRGHSTSTTTQQEYGYEEGSSTPYYTAWEDQTEDWYYQCIGSMIAANSLIRSMPGVDKDRVGCTGYSWGGIIISTLIGVDQRFAAAIPVYGCGYLYDAPGGYWSVMGRLPELGQYRWKYQYDGMNYLAYTSTPTLYINSTNDNHFYTSQWEKTAALVPGVSRSMRNALSHSGGVSQTVAEVYSFFSKHLKHGDDLSIPEFNDLRFENDTLYCTLSNVEDDFKAYLLFTEYKLSKLDGLGFTTSSDCNALWYKDLIEVKDGKIAHRVPDDYERWMINIEYPNPDPDLIVEYEVEDERPFYSDTQSKNAGSDVYMNYSSKIFFRDNL